MSIIDNSPRYSIVVPVYKNEGSIPRLLKALEYIDEQLANKLEVVFVVDGSPDNSFLLLKNTLQEVPFAAQLILLSRNYGAQAASRTGFMMANGEYCCILAADLQEPPELVLEMLMVLEKDEADISIAVKNSRRDPFFGKIMANIFWWCYRKLIMPDMPHGGVGGGWGCNKLVRDNFLALSESRSSDVALLFWMGFRRKYVLYDRLARQEGKSAWTFRKKVAYMMDSVFAFTDLPIRLLLRLGAVGMLVAAVFGLLTIYAKISGNIPIPGYTATLILILFFGALNIFGLGLVGNYAWRAYENTKNRPVSIIAMKLDNESKKHGIQ